MDNIYLDTNIIVSLYLKDKNYEEVKSALDTLSNLRDVQFVTSDFSFIETAKVLINTHHEQPKTVAKEINKIQKNSKIGDFVFTILETSPDSTYEFNDFWNDVGQNMNLYNPGWGDSFHCVIMKNNKVKKILSRDEKDDFEIVPGIELMHPRDIRIED